MAVMPVLQRALQHIAHERPPDPIGHLGRWILREIEVEEAVRARAIEAERDAVELEAYLQAQREAEERQRIRRVQSHFDAVATASAQVRADVGAGVAEARIELEAAYGSADAVMVQERTMALAARLFEESDFAVEDLTMGRPVTAEVWRILEAFLTTLGYMHGGLVHIRSQGYRAPLDLESLRTVMGHGHFWRRVRVYSPAAGDTRDKLVAAHSLLPGLDGSSDSVCRSPLGLLATKALLYVQAATQAFAEQLASLWSSAKIGSLKELHYLFGSGVAPGVAEMSVLPFSDALPLPPRIADDTLHLHVAWAEEWVAESTEVDVSILLMDRFGTCVDAIFHMKPESEQGCSSRVPAESQVPFADLLNQLEGGAAPAVGEATEMAGEGDDEGIAEGADGEPSEPPVGDTPAPEAAGSGLVVRVCKPTALTATRTSSDLVPQLVTDAGSGVYEIPPRPAEDAAATPVARGWQRARDAVSVGPLFDQKREDAYRHRWAWQRAKDAAAGLPHKPLLQWCHDVFELNLGATDAAVVAYAVVIGASVEGETLQRLRRGSVRLLAGAERRLVAECQMELSAVRETEFLLGMLARNSVGSVDPSTGVSSAGRWMFRVVGEAVPPVPEGRADPGQNFMRALGLTRYYLGYDGLVDPALLQTLPEVNPFALLPGDIFPIPDAIVDCELRVGCGWDIRPLVTIDVDLNIVAFSDEQFYDQVDFMNAQMRGGGLRHLGDNRTGVGEGDDESIVMLLRDIDPAVTCIFIVLTIFEGGSFESVDNLSVRIVSKRPTRVFGDAREKEICRFSIEGCSERLGSATAATMVKIHCDRDGWVFETMCEPTEGKTAHELRAELEQFL